MDALRQQLTAAFQHPHVNGLKSIYSGLLDHAVPLTGQAKKEYMKTYEKKKRLGWGRILIEAMGGRCMTIGCRSIDDLELDHMIPLHAGGKDSYSNIQVLCSKCHMIKTQKERAELNRWRLGIGKHPADIRAAMDKIALKPVTVKTLNKMGSKSSTRVFCEFCRTYVPYDEWLKHIKSDRRLKADMQNPF